jgi:hypothetical protein
MISNTSSFSDRERYKALSILNKHIGKQKAISMQVFYEKVFNKCPATAISGTRKIRLLITQLRNQGEPICSTTGGGYYLASAGSELDDYLSRLLSQAVRKLLIVNRIKKITIQELCSQIEINLENESMAAE